MPLSVASTHTINGVISNTAHKSMLIILLCNFVISPALFVDGGWVYRKMRVTAHYTSKESSEFYICWVICFYYNITIQMCVFGHGCKSLKKTGITESLFHGRNGLRQGEEGQPFGFGIASRVPPVTEIGSILATVNLLQLYCNMLHVFCRVAHIQLGIVL